MEQRVLSSENIVEGSVLILVEAIEQKRKEGKEFNLALSGGTSPIALYEKLAQKINLMKGLVLNVYQVDDRYVDQKHEDSNQKLVNEHFIDLLEKHNTVNTFFINTDLPIENAANLYDELIAKVTLDVAIMGLGTDGHTASIFPDEKYARIRYDKDVIHTDEHNGYKRVTMTHKSLLRVEQLFFYVPGIFKRKIIEKISNAANIDVFPASFLLHKHKNTLLIKEK